MLTPPVTPTTNEEPQQPTARSEYFGDAASIFESTAFERMLIGATVAVVLSEIGAGLVALRRLPSGAMTSMHRTIPSFHVISQASSGNTAESAAPTVAQY